MPRNGSGTMSRTNSRFSGSTVWQSDYNATQKIDYQGHDAHDNDLATEITDSLSRSGKGAMLANLDFGNFKAVNMAAPTARTDGVNLAALQDGAFTWLGTTAGTGTAYTASSTPSFASYAVGQTFRFIAHTANTGGATLNINSVGAVPIRKDDATTVLSANDIPASSIVTVVYDTTSTPHFRLIAINQNTWVRGNTFGSPDAATNLRSNGTNKWVIDTSGVLTGQNGNNIVNCSSSGQNLILESGSAALCRVSGGNSLNFSAGGADRLVLTAGALTYSDSRLDIEASTSGLILTIGNEADNLITFGATGGITIKSNPMGIATGSNITLDCNGSSLSSGIQLQKGGFTCLGIRGDGDLYLDLQTVAATAGAIAEYLVIDVNGTTRKIALYAV